MEPFNFFAYTWGYEDTEVSYGSGKTGFQCIIRAYGWNERNESVVMQVEDFQLPVLIELPDHMEWDPCSVNAVRDRLQSLNSNARFRPLSIEYVEKSRSYYAYVEGIPEDERKVSLKYRHKKFPYLLAWFSSTKASDAFVGTLRREVNVTGMGKIKFKTHASEGSITPILKYVGIRQLPTAGWMVGKGERVPRDDKVTTRQIEYKVLWDNVSPMPEEQSMKMPVVYPKVMSFDNEANSSIMSSMPKSEREKDKVFLIGWTMLDPPKDGRPKQYRKFLITLADCDPIEGVTIYKVRTEAEACTKWVEKMREEDPEVILGFNILGWDINYMIERCRQHWPEWRDEFDQMSPVIGKHCPEEEINWGSSGAGKNTFKFLNVEGRLLVDMLPYVKRNYKLPNYRLKTICEEYLKGQNKDDVTPKEIFKAWRQHLASQYDPDLKPGASKEMARIGHYCCVDSYVTLLLYEKLLTWFDLTEAATTCQVPMFDMFTKGQQIKLFSQVYRYAWHNGIVVESNAYQSADNEHYEGAYVSEPIKGLYNMVVPLDFCSLYPSIMMAYNIDYSKLVVDSKIPDEDCTVMIWSSHKYCGCPKDECPGKKAPKTKDGGTKRVCAEYKYRWLKHEVSGKGILPTLLENLIAARKRTRKIIAANELEIIVLKKFLAHEPLTDEQVAKWSERVKQMQDRQERNPILELARDNVSPLSDAQKASIKEYIEQLESLNLILDRRQNAYKINANSMYGAMGVKRGYLPFLPGAMCVTFMGRVNIQKVNRYIETVAGGKVIYNDTDSAYCYFPAFDGLPVIQLWNHALKIVADVKHLFPPPMSLDFESKIYKKFLILTKKRYAAQSVNEEGKVDPKLMKRGIILQRRDNCLGLREAYQALVLKIFEHHETLVQLRQQIVQLETKDRIALQMWESDIQELATQQGLVKIPERPPTGIAKHRLLRDHPVVQSLLSLIVDAINSLFQWKYGFRHFVITKQIARDINSYKSVAKPCPDCGEPLNACEGRVSECTKCGYIGTRRNLPGHVELGLRMQKRGIPIGAGTRVEYVILNDGHGYKKSATQTEKLEDVNYFAEFREILRLSYIDYMKQMINPIDELCEVVLGMEQFVKQQWNYRINYSKVVDRIKAIGQPTITFAD